MKVDSVTSAISAPSGRPNCDQALNGFIVHHQKASGCAEMRIHGIPGAMLTDRQLSSRGMKDP